jgi:hypothetical protein
MNTSIRETNIVLQSVSAAISRSKDVFISLPEMSETCSKLDIEDLTDSIWEYDLTEKYDTTTRFLLYLLFNSMNFSFWSIPRWSIEYNESEYIGSHGMMGALIRALEDELPILKPKYLSDISRDDVNFIFRGNTSIPMPDERVMILRELGHSLYNYGIHKLESLFTSDLTSPQDIINIIIKLFPSFNDTSKIGGYRVCFYKRAQLLVAQCLKLFKESVFSRFADFFTVFADYRLPQALREMGVIQYSSKLSELVDNGETLRQGSLEEAEIRCNTIWACELIRKELLSIKKVNVNSIQIDSWLWRYAKKLDSTISPHHKVRTIYY